MSRGPKKVCLINPPTTHPREVGLYFPMALLTLGGVLKAKGVPAELWDFDLYYKKTGNSTEAKFRNLLRHGVLGSEASVFGISSIDSNLPMALWIAREIKALRPGATVILGGPQPSAVPLPILEHFDFVDLVAVGEGENTLMDLIDTEFDLAQCTTIPGLAVRIAGKPTLTPHRTLAPCLDDLPFPDYSLIDFRDYVSERRGYFLPNVEVGRGCPFHCTFCSTALMWEKDFRVKSPARILEEMELLHREHGFTRFDFIHDNFTTSRKFVLDFCAHMEEKNRNGLTWIASSRTDCIDVPRLERMHGAGLRGLFFGVETGSPRMQQVIKKNLDFSKFEPILERANRLGINTTTAFILGFPEEGREDMDQTVARALHYRSLGTTRVFFSKLSPLAGTPIFQEHFTRLDQVNTAIVTIPQHFELEYVKDLIKRHPDLFSSFYHVPHPQFSMDYITRFTEFSNLMLNGCPHMAIPLLTSRGWTASDLFELWMPWAENRSIPYYDYRVYSDWEFKEHFREFLEQILYQPKPRPMIHSLSYAASPR